VNLVVTTPDRVMLAVDGVTALRAEDASGSFGILPGHADLLTVLAPSVMVWRDGAGVPHYIAVRGGVLTVTGGNTVSVATREAFTADDLDALDAGLRAAAEAERDAESHARTATAALEAAAIRHIRRTLEADRTGGRLPPWEVG
jgi:F-type H+-transporting ATPase subunit epsilon